MEVCVLQIYGDEPILRPDLHCDPFQRQHFEYEHLDKAVELAQIYDRKQPPHPFWE